MSDWFRKLVTKAIRTNGTEQVNQPALNLVAGEGVELTVQDRPLDGETRVTVSSTVTAISATAAYTTLANTTSGSAVPVETPLDEIVAVNVASATALRAANPNIAKIAVMAGAGGGEFYWDASSSATDDGSLVIMPTGWSGPGRWLRLDVNPAYNVKWFGAVGDGVTDDATAIQAALNAAGQSRAVFFPMGTYLVNTPINITSRKLVGERHGLSLSTGGVVLKAGAAIDAVVYTLNNPGTIENIILDANELADYGLHMARSGGPVTWVRNVVATKATVAGFFFDECQVMGAERLLAYGNLGHGVVIQDCNASRFSFIQSRQNQGHGIHVKRSVASGGVYLVNCNVENNTSTPVYIEGTRSTCLLENIWIENSTEGDGIEIDGASLVNVVNCRVTGFSDGTHRAYRLTNGTKNCLITGCCAAPGDGNESFASIEIAAGCRNNRVFGNYRISDIVTWSLAVNYEDRNWVDQRTVGHQTAAPSSGTWERGDIIWNSTPSAGGAPGWVCVTGGTPGTWKAMANLEA